MLQCLLIQLIHFVKAFVVTSRYKQHEIISSKNKKIAATINDNGAYKFKTCNLTGNVKKKFALTMSKIKLIIIQLIYFIEPYLVRPRYKQHKITSSKIKKIAASFNNKCSLKLKAYKLTDDEKESL